MTFAVMQRKRGMMTMMNDLISRQTAIDAPEKLIKDCNPDHFVGHQKFIEFMDDAEIGRFGNWQFANGFNLGLTAAEVEIKNLPSTQQWIPVSERLPEKKTEVIYSLENHYVSTGYMTDRDYEGNIAELHWEDMESGVLIYPEAWMPLPEPYKEGEG